MRRGGSEQLGGRGRERRRRPRSRPAAAQAMLGCRVPGRLAEEDRLSYSGKKQGDRAAGAGWGKKV